MGITHLLSKENAPLDRLALDRLQLLPRETCEMTTDGRELCFYILQGDISISYRAERADSPPDWGTHMFSVLRTPQENHVTVSRLPGGILWKVELRNMSDTVACDVLLASVTGVFHADIDPVTHLSTVEHLVGYEGLNPPRETTISRRVREVNTPDGYLIHCGETLNVPGGWSSFPAHATPDEARTRYASHEEAFFVVTPGYGIMHLDGYWCDGSHAEGIVKISNGEAIATPLGAHEIVFSPGAWGWYTWFYVSFLEKTYHRWFSDRVGTYVR